MTRLASLRAGGRRDQSHRNRLVRRRRARPAICAVMAVAVANTTVTGVTDDLSAIGRLCPRAMPLNRRVSFEQMDR